MEFTSALTLIFVYASSLSSQAALPNTSRDVGMIDVMKSTTVIWIGGEMFFQPEACNSHKAISCPNDSEHCKLMVSTALAAKMAGNKVEFAFSTLCNGSFADVDRFRLMND